MASGDTLATSALSTEEEDLLRRSKKKSKEYDFWEELNGEDERACSEGMEEVEEDNIKILCPSVKLSKSERLGVCIPWKRALIIKLLGKRVSLKSLQGRLHKLWQPKERMEVIDLDNDYFVVRFADWSDLNRVYEGGPWVIMGHYLVIQRWKPEFLPFEEEFKRVSVWIRIPGLPIEYYDDHILWRIGDVWVIPSRLILILSSNLMMSSTQVWLQNVVSLPVFVWKWIFASSDMPDNEHTASPESGHREAGEKVVNGGSIAEEVFGPWMMVQRKSRGKNQKGSEGDSPNVNSQGSNHAIPNHARSGSRFNVLNKESLDGTELTQEENQDYEQEVREGPENQRNNHTNATRKSQQNPPLMGRQIEGKSKTNPLNKGKPEILNLKESQNLHVRPTDGETLEHPRGGKRANKSPILGSVNNQAGQQQLGSEACTDQQHMLVEPTGQITCGMEVDGNDGPRELVDFLGPHRAMGDPGESKLVVSPHDKPSDAFHNGPEPNKDASLMNCENFSQPAMEGIVFQQREPGPGTYHQQEEIKNEIVGFFKKLYCDDGTLLALPRRGSGRSTRFWEDRWLHSGLLLRDACLVPFQEIWSTALVRDFADPIQGWRLNTLYGLLPADVVAKIVALPCPNPSLGPDSVCWGGTPNGKFSTKTAYSLIESSYQFVQDPVWRAVWKSKGFRQGFMESDVCPLCMNHEETTTHIIRDCVKVQQVWFHSARGILPSDFFSASVREWIWSNIGPRSDSNWRIIFGLTIWAIWKHCNSCVFDSTPFSVEGVVALVQSNLVTGQSSWTHKVQHHNRYQYSLVGWAFPERGWIKANVDGYVIQQSLLAGCGGVFRGADGRWICGFTYNLGRSNVLLAELRGIETALNIAWDKADHALEAQALACGFLPYLPRG
ncbi:hypothetical protein SESBI_09060 [Sesbania bispinosa]|nr:hypothetical protein SESBI_09060 [Sesbania bispinosa]